MKRREQGETVKINLNVFQVEFKIFFLHAAYHEVTGYMEVTVRDSTVVLVPYVVRYALRSFRARLKK